MDRSHRTRPPDVEEALSSMLWRPYDDDGVDESPPYQRRPIGKSAKLRRSQIESPSTRFSYPFVSSIRTRQGEPPTYDKIMTSQKRLSVPVPTTQQPYFVGTAPSQRLNQSFTDEFLSSRCPANLVSCGLFLFIYP